MSINLKSTYVTRQSALIREAFDSMCEGIYTNMFLNDWYAHGHRKYVAERLNLCEGTRGGGSGMSSSSEIRTVVSELRKRAARGGRRPLHTTRLQLFTCLRDAVVVSAFAFSYVQINLNLVY